MKEIKLRPCPFCGKESRMYQFHPKVIIECNNLKCPVYPSIKSESIEESSALWNGPDPWQPIETALRRWDCPLLLWDGCQMTICHWDVTSFDWITDKGDVFKATHWQPLPQGPRSK